MEVLMQRLKTEGLKCKPEKIIECFYCEKELTVIDAYLDDQELLVCGSCAVNHQA